jgi:hypothetical protein
VVDYMNARGTCPDCGEFRGWADGPPHVCHPVCTKSDKGCKAKQLGFAHCKTICGAMLIQNDSILKNGPLT